MQPLGDLENVNNWLKEKFGKDDLGRAKFRLSWSEDQFEKRRGTFNEFAGKIFVRKFTGIATVPKYPYVKERWILEQYIAFPSVEIVSSENGSYEPVWVFSDKNGDYIRPIQRAVEFILWTLLFGTKDKMTPKGLKDEEQNQIESETKFFQEYLENDRPYLATMLANKEAITVPDMEKTNG
jgi:hypothetical protein